MGSAPPTSPVHHAKQIAAHVKAVARMGPRQQLAAKTRKFRSAFAPRCIPVANRQTTKPAHGMVFASRKPKNVSVVTAVSIDAANTIQESHVSATRHASKQAIVVTISAISAQRY